MGLFTGMMVYVVAWWLVFFMALPIGVKSEGEPEENVPEGTPSSAPNRPKLLMKMAIATVGAFVVWAVLYYIVSNGLVQLRPN